MRDVKKITILSMLLSIAIVLNIIEMQISIIPIPGAKIGFANLATLIVLYIYGFKEAFALNVLRVVMVALLSPSGFNYTFYMALAGAISSICLMAFCKSFFKLHVVTISVIGALIHNLAQVLVLMISLETQYLIYYYPFMLILGIPSGILIGIITARFLKVFNTHQLIHQGDQLKLVMPNLSHQREVQKWIKEFKKLNLTRIEGGSSLESLPYQEWLNTINNDYYLKLENYVKSYTFFLVKNKTVLGVVNCRLELNEHLKVQGGHIGYSIRRKYQNQGYGKVQLRLALKNYQVWGYDTVLLTCLKTNIPSQKVILSQGGVFEKEIKYLDEEIYHYTISIKPKEEPLN